MVAGPARVVDGDTIVVGEVRVRLEGIDAPEAGQVCTRATPPEAWPCGAVATATLARFIGSNEVTCQSRGLDKYGRMLGICFLGQQDINAWMVREGQAWAFTKYSASYVKEEAEARNRRAGIWQGEAMPAWEYRAQHWTRAEPQAPPGLRDQGQRHAERQDLPHAVEPLVFPDQDGSGTGQALVLQ